MSINLTDEINAATKKGKIAAAKQVFLEGDSQNVQKEIEDINARHDTLSSKHDGLNATVSEHTTQIANNQNQITANKSAQDEKNASLDANMAKLNTRDEQITELVKGVTATGGASVATAVTYDNTSSQLVSATVQGAVDELQSSKISKTSISQESGNAEDKIMSQKAVSNKLNDLTTTYDCSQKGTIPFNTLQEALSTVPSEIKKYCKYILYNSEKSPIYNLYRLRTKVWSDLKRDWEKVDKTYISNLDLQDIIVELYIEQSKGESFFDKEYVIQIDTESQEKIFRIYEDNKEVCTVTDFSSEVLKIVENEGSDVHGYVILNSTPIKNSIFSGYFTKEVSLKETNPIIFSYLINANNTQDSITNEIVRVVHNLYDKSMTSIDTALDANTGTTYSVNGWIASDFIAVHKGTTYYGYNLNTNGFFGKLCIYDSDKQFLKAISDVNIYSATEDGYIRFSCDQNNMKCMFLDGVSTEYIPFGEYKIYINSNYIEDNSILPAQLSIMDVKRVNLINPSLVSIDQAIVNGVPSEFSDYCLTDFIEVSANKKYYFGVNGEKQKKYQCAKYKKDGTLLQVCNDEYPVSPTEDCFVRISMKDMNFTKWQLQEGSEVTSFVDYEDVYATIKSKYLKEKADKDYIDTELSKKFDKEDIVQELGEEENKVVSQKALNNEINKLKPYLGKKVLILGDSITHLDTSSYGWVKYFMEICKPLIKVNLAVDGATWRDKVANQIYDGNPQPSTDGNCIGNQVQKVLNEKEKGTTDYSNFDVIIIAAGTNDGGNGADGETIESVDTLFVANYDNGGVGSNHIPFSIVPLDSIDRQKFAGIMRYTYQKLSDAYPNAVFVITTPLQEVYESFASTYAKGELFKYIAKRLSINCFDTLECGICNLYESSISDIDYDNPSGEVSKVKRDLADGIHTNESGARKLGGYIARKFKELFI